MITIRRCGGSRFNHVEPEARKRRMRDIVVLTVRSSALAKVVCTPGQVITGSQHGLPLKAVAEAAVSFGEVVGTSVLATKAQASASAKDRRNGYHAKEKNECAS